MASNACSILRVVKGDQSKAARLIVARLSGTVSRHTATWKPLPDDQHAAAVAELAEIATQTSKARRGQLHPPRQTLRRDLLAEVAGIGLGASAARSEPEQKRARIAADLLIEAGADLAEVEKWIPEGRDRVERSGPAFSRAAPLHWSKPPGPSQPTQRTS